MKTTILYLAPQEARRRVGNLGAFCDATTMLDQRTLDATIIVNNRLDPKIQRAYLKHEGVQLGILREWAGHGGSIPSIMPNAHENGLQAGLDEAEKLGVLEQYKKRRAMWSKEYGG